MIVKTKDYGEWSLWMCGIICGGVVIVTVPLWKNTIFLQKNYFFDHFPLWFNIFPKYAPKIFLDLYD